MSEFGAAGSQPGVEVWRIENKVPVAVPAKSFGIFYDGDSYIVLKTTQKPGYSSMTYYLFFWLGTESEQGEKGIAAYKTVELDESVLGGAATQYREVQGYESELFMSCFKSVEYKKGGVDSGFVKVDRDAYDNRLLQLKGSRTVRVKEVALAAGSLNAGDVFIVDTPACVYQWNGAESNRKEKSKALEVSIAIKDEIHGGKADILAFDQGEEPEAFWELLGGKSEVAAAVADTETVAVRGALKLIQVSDDSGSVKLTELSSGGELAKSQLSTSDVYIVDNTTQIFVWIGKGASPTERAEGMGKAEKYMLESGRPKHTKVTKVMEGAEPPVFKSNFASWAEPVAAFDFSQPSARGEASVAARPRQDSVGTLVQGMEAASVEAKVTLLPEGVTEVWRIEELHPVPMEAEKFGQFFAGDSYVVKHTYKEGTKEAYVIYFWQGSKSSKDEIGASALHAKEMDDAVGGAATQVRVIQGKEPAHFVALFGGKMVIHSGGKASGAKNAEDDDSYDVDGISLFHVKGTCETDARAVQVPEKAASLNSGDCFVLAVPDKVFCWKGELANEVEGATALAVSAVVAAGREVESVAEGSEPDAFWEAVGGKGEYVKAKSAPELDREATLFHCSNAKGSFQVEQVIDFSQADLEESDVYILDSYTTIFLWIGSEATELEKSMVESTAERYVKSAGYSSDTAIVTIKSGSEPIYFTCNFLGWDPEKAKAFVDPYAARLAEIKAEQDAKAAAAAAELEAKDAAKQPDPWE